MKLLLYRELWYSSRERRYLILQQKIYFAVTFSGYKNVVSNLRVIPSFADDITVQKKLTLSSKIWYMYMYLFRIKRLEVR